MSIETLPQPQTDGLRIVEEHCRNSGRQATIIIEGQGQEQLRGMPAREMVLQYAQAKFGMTKAGISGSGGPYPAHAVRADGTLDESQLLRPNPPGARQRVDYQVTSGL